MNASDVETAIGRVMMLAAGPLDTAEQETAVEEALDVFDDVASRRRLAVVLALRAAEKLPDGSAVGLFSFHDLAALAIITEAHDPALVRRMVDRLPASHLADVATSLLAFWRQACSLAAMAALRDLEIPDHAPTEGR